MLLALLQAAVAEAAVLAEQHADIPADVKAELATKSGTVTPAWWGFKTFLKVGVYLAQELMV